MQLVAREWAKWYTLSRVEGTRTRGSHRMGINADIARFLLAAHVADTDFSQVLTLVRGQ